MASSSTVKSAQKLGKRQDNLITKFADTSFRTHRDKYPARYFEDSEKEKNLRLFQEYAAELQTSGIPAYYNIDKSDVKLIKKKANEEELSAFDAYIETYFNFNDPKDVRLVKEMVPEYFTRREEEMNRSLELQKKMNKIALFGCQSREDLELLFALDAQLIRPSQHASWVLPAFNLDDNRAKYNRGYYSLHRITTDSRRVNDTVFNRYAGPAFNRADGSSGMVAPQQGNARLGMRSGTQNDTFNDPLNPGVGLGNWAGVPARIFSNQNIINMNPINRILGYQYRDDAGQGNQGYWRGQYR